jgi:hypothetical protein
LTTSIAFFLAPRGGRPDLQLFEAQHRFDSILADLGVVSAPRASDARACPTSNLNELSRPTSPDSKLEPCLGMYLNGHDQRLQPRPAFRSKPCLECQNTESLFYQIHFKLPLRAPETSQVPPSQAIWEGYRQAQRFPAARFATACYVEPSHLVPGHD